MEHHCNTCFYQHVEGAMKPCKGCSGYDKYVAADAYFDERFDERWDFAVKQFDDLQATYDTVEKPKHYMLFETEGIEVRDVIEKLTEKIDKSEFIFEGMQYADYVQMMQYLMRFMDKNGVEDLRKAQWYMERLLENYE